MRAIVVTQERFNELNQECQEYCAEDIPGYSANNWCNEIIHPDTGQIAFTVKDKVLPVLGGEEIVELTEDWFNVEVL